MNDLNFAAMVNAARGFPLPQIFVPVKAAGCDILDNRNDTIARCFSPQMAIRIAELINRDAGLG